MGISQNPKFIEAVVWERARYYSCTRKALEYLERSCGRSVGLEEIADIVGMEKTAFSKAFKHKTGVTLHEFSDAYRISQAVLRMEVSDCSITEIAFNVGFNSLDVFERVFKRVAGTTPSCYRSEILTKNGLKVTDANKIRKVAK